MSSAVLRDCLRSTFRAWPTVGFNPGVLSIQSKESSYRKLVQSLRGFYSGTTNAEAMKAEFLNHLNVSWLYCPDTVIRKGYEFLSTVHTNTIRTDEEKQRALGAFWGQRHTSAQCRPTHLPSRAITLGRQTKYRDTTSDVRNGPLSTCGPPLLDTPDAGPQTHCVSIFHSTMRFGTS